MIRNYFLYSVLFYSLLLSDQALSQGEDHGNDLPYVVSSHYGGTRLSDGSFIEDRDSSDVIADGLATEYPYQRSYWSIKTSLPQNSLQSMQNAATLVTREFLQEQGLTDSTAIARIIEEAALLQRDPAFTSGIATSKPANISADTWEIVSELRATTNNAIAE